MHSLSDLGWTSSLDDAMRHVHSDDLRPARVSVAQRGRFQLLGLGDHPVWGALSGQLRHHAADPLDLPAVGDWVLVRPGDTPVIQRLLPRASCFVRKAVGMGGAPQVVAANIDRVLVVTAAGGDLSPRRIERYLAAVWDGGAEPVVVVNKSDLVTDWASITQTLRACAAGVPVAYVSATAEGGLAELLPLVEPGETLALVGSSGVGKSTLTNRLLGEARLETQAVREGDDKGRHTTTHRELFVAPSGALVIDTPGMRELGLWNAEGGLTAAFGDVEGLAGACRFRDCTHQGEPGCAVTEAVHTGALDAERLASYDKLQKELAFEERRSDPRAAANAKRRWKEIHKSARARTELLRSQGRKA